jgi:hypothetical protein
MIGKRPPVGPLLTLAAMAALVAVSVALQPAAPQISAASARRIQKGMTAAEVEAILGPPRDEQSPAERHWLGRAEVLVHGGEWRIPTRAAHWLQDEVRITVTYYADGRVAWVRMWPAGPHDDRWWRRDH